MSTAFFPFSQDGGCLDDVVERIGRIDELPMAVICRKVGLATALTQLRSASLCLRLPPHAHARQPHVVQILNGLLYLEELQVLHRDLKPANVLCNTYVSSHPLAISP
jgi:serine/threonine protein kinase